MTEILYKAIDDIKLVSESAEVVIPKGQVWTLDAIKPKGFVIKRGYVRVTISEDVADVYFVRSA